MRDASRISAGRFVHSVGAMWVGAPRHVAVSSDSHRPDFLLFQLPRRVAAAVAAAAVAAVVAASVRARAGGFLLLHVGLGLDARARQLVVLLLQQVGERLHTRCPHAALHAYLVNQRTRVLCRQSRHRRVQLLGLRQVLASIR